jgi:hypothetical protein
LCKSGKFLPFYNLQQELEIYQRILALKCKQILLERICSITNSNVLSNVNYMST